MYSFLGFPKFIKHLRQARILLLSGAMGTGKTLLSVALGHHLLQGEYVSSAAYNFPVVHGGVPARRYCYAAIDEAGVFFDARVAWKKKELNELSAKLVAFLRKHGSYLVIPSYLTPDARFRKGLRMWRRSTITKYLWVYQWELGPEETEERRPGINFWEGQLVFFNPPYFYGQYDTYFEPWNELTFAFIKELNEQEYPFAVSWPTA